MYPDGRHQIELFIKGEGIEIKRITFCINDFGVSRYRFQEGGEINRFAVETSVYKEIAEINIHTWNKDGQHVDLVHEENLADGTVVEKDVEVTINEKVYQYHYYVRYFIERNMF